MAVLSSWLDKCEVIVSFPGTEGHINCWSFVSDHDKHQIKGSVCINRLWPHPEIWCCESSRWKTMTWCEFHNDELWQSFGCDAVTKSPSAVQLWECTDTLGIWNSSCVTLGNAEATKGQDSLGLWATPQKCCILATRFFHQRRPYLMTPSL